MAKEDPVTDKQLAYAYDLILKLTPREQIIQKKKIAECKNRGELGNLITELRSLTGW